MTEMTVEQIIDIRFGSSDTASHWEFNHGSVDQPTEALDQSDSYHHTHITSTTMHSMAEFFLVEQNEGADDIAPNTLLLNIKE